jgi:hypothetical protein
MPVAVLSTHPGSGAPTGPANPFTRGQDLLRLAAGGNGRMLESGRETSVGADWRSEGKHAQAGGAATG